MAEGSKPGVAEAVWKRAWRETKATLTGAVWGVATLVVCAGAVVALTTPFLSNDHPNWQKALVAGAGVIAGFLLGLGILFAVIATRTPYRQRDDFVRALDDAESKHWLLARDHEDALNAMRAKFEGLMDDTRERHSSQLAELQEHIAYLEKRLTPELLLEGGDGPEFEKLINIGELYRRYGEGIPELKSGAYIRDSTALKVIKVINDSEVPIEGVRADITASSNPFLLLPRSLKWWHSDDLTTNLMPGRSAYAEIGLIMRLEVDLNKKGVMHDWPIPIALAAMPPGSTVTFTAWAPDGVRSPPATFIFRSPFRVPSPDFKLPYDVLPLMERIEEEK
jgi:hypothetical protein